MKKTLLISIFSFALIILNSCKEEIVNNPVGNKPPNTSLTLFPDSTIAPQPSRLKVAWWGDDSDGLIVGFYYSWDGNSWTFTDKNEILFSLQIGAVDTTYLFRVSAVDNGGNGVYDNNLFQNGMDFGPEPFIDANNDGNYNPGEKFYDIGLIDPTPASLDFPLKNTAPTIEWNTLSTLPETSFPVMSFGWNADDLDGVNTILKINIALNDTNSSNIIALDGSVRTVTLRTKDFSSSNPLMEILIEGVESNIFSEKLPGLKLDDLNKIYVQAVDISGAKSDFITLPDTGKTWFVKKPKGTILIMDDYITIDGAPEFYDSMMDSLGLANKFDTYDLLSQKPPYTSVTFLQTLKLFKYVLWYSDNNPSLDLAASSVQKYIDAGGKIAFSMQFPQTVDPALLQSFLPINPDSIYSKTSLLPNTIVSADTTTNSEYPNLITTGSLFRIKSFYLNPNGAIPVYYFPNNEVKGFIGFFNNTKSLFFYGLPFNKSNGGAANVKTLLSKIFFEDFGVTP